jgi:hypothetical protein
MGQRSIKIAIPHHFGTFPGAGMLPDASSFQTELAKLKINFFEIKPGETVSFRGKQLVRSK